MYEYEELPAITLNPKFFTKYSAKLQLLYYRHPYLEQETVNHLVAKPPEGHPLSEITKFTLSTITVSQFTSKRVFDCLIARLSCNLCFKPSLWPYVVQNRRHTSQDQCG